MKPDFNNEELVPGICYLVKSTSNSIHEKWVSIERIGDHYDGLMVNIFTGQAKHWSRLDIIRKFDLDD